MKNSDFIQFAFKINENLTEKYNTQKFKFYKYNTSLTIEILDKVIPEILKDSEFEQFVKYSDEHKQDTNYYQKEIRTVDMITWDSFAGDNKDEKTGKHLWKFKYLIESENDGETWIQEMQKLSSMIAPCKLIITYGRALSDDVDNGIKTTADNKGVKLLKHAEKILNVIDNKNDEEFIIMFGEELDNLKKTDKVDSLYDIYYYNSSNCKSGERKFTKIN